MSSARDRREERRKNSTARKRAETHSSGVSTTTLNLPDGMSFFEPKEGMCEIDIVGFIAKEGNPFAKPGQLHYERTFYTYRSVGVDEKSYVCSSKTFGKADYIQEFRQKEAKKDDADPDFLKSLAPKERQIFLVYDRKAPEKGLQLWERSYHTFGKLLDSRIQKSPVERDWDLFYYPDEDGFTLEVTFQTESGGGYSFLDATAIDFISRRAALPDAIANHQYCLDDFLVETPYEVLRDAFLGVGKDKEQEADGGSSKESSTETSSREEKQDTSRDTRKEEIDQALSPQGVREKGKQAFFNGKSVEDSGWKKDTERHQWWVEGWNAGKKEADDAFDKKKEEPKKVEIPKWMVRDAAVTFGGKKFTVLRVPEDGGSVKLLDENDELVSAPISEVTEFRKAEERREEQPKQTESSSKKDEEAPWDKGWE